MNQTIKYCPVCRTPLKRRRSDGRSRLVCLTCGRVNYQNPLPAATIFVRDSKNHILLVKRGVPPRKGSWALPSGFIEIDETPKQTCLRELKEETNVEGRIVRLIGVYCERTKMYKSVLSVAYEVEPSACHLSAGSDCTDAKFFALDELPPIPFASHRQIIKDGLKKGKPDA